MVNNGVFQPGENRIVSFGPHAAPGESEFASQIATGSPPATATFLILPLSKNPTHLLSADTNGSVAPSVPGSGLASKDPKSRTYNRSAAIATNRPSGESAGSDKPLPVGGATMRCV